MPTAFVVRERVPSFRFEYLGSVAKHLEALVDAKERPCCRALLFARARGVRLQGRHAELQRRKRRRAAPRCERFPLELGGRRLVQWQRLTTETTARSLTPVGTLARCRHFDAVTL